MVYLRATLALHALVITDYASPILDQGASSNGAVASSNGNATALSTAEIGLNITGSLVRRMDPGQPADDELIREYEPRGRELYTDLMLADIPYHDRMVTAAMGGTPDPHDAQWQRGFDATDSGQRSSAQRIMTRFNREWSIREMMPSADALNGLSHVFDCLQVGLSPDSQGKDKQRQVSQEMYPQGLNYRVAFQQDKEYFPVDGSQHRRPATNAVYDAVVNLVDGVIVIKKSESPLTAPDMTTGTAPFIHSLSDIIWYTWKDMRKQAQYRKIPIQGRPDSKTAPVWAVDKEHDWANNAALSDMLGFVNYIIVETIEMPDTSSIIARCRDAMSGRGQQLKEPIFSIDHWCYYALLATPESQEIVQFLTQHKAAESTGHKVLYYIQIIENSVTKKPGLMFTVGDMSEYAMTTIEAEEAKWLPTRLQGQHLQHGATQQAQAAGAAVAGPSGNQGTEGEDGDSPNRYDMMEWQSDSPPADYSYPNGQ